MIASGDMGPNNSDSGSLSAALPDTLNRREREHYLGIVHKGRAGTASKEMEVEVRWILIIFDVMLSSPLDTIVSEIMDIYDAACMIGDNP